MQTYFSGPVGRRFLVRAISFTVLLVAVIALVSVKAQTGMLRSQMDTRGTAMANYMAKTSIFYYRN
jgi:hypothetical protein